MPVFHNILTDGYLITQDDLTRFVPMRSLADPPVIHNALGVMCQRSYAAVDTLPRPLDADIAVITVAVNHDSKQPVDPLNVRVGRNYVMDVVGFVVPLSALSFWDVRFDGALDLEVEYYRLFDRAAFISAGCIYSDDRRWTVSGATLSVRNNTTLNHFPCPEEKQDEKITPQ